MNLGPLRVEQKNPLKSRSQQTRIYKTFYGAFCTLILLALTALFCLARGTWVLNETNTLYFLTKVDVQTIPSVFANFSASPHTGSEQEIQVALHHTRLNRTLTFDEYVQFGRFNVTSDTNNATLYDCGDN